MDIHVLNDFHVELIERHAVYVSAHLDQLNLFVTLPLVSRYRVLRKAFFSSRNENMYIYIYSCIYDVCKLIIVMDRVL